MVINLQDAPDTLADKLEESELAIFANSAPVKASDLAEERNNGIVNHFQFIFQIASRLPLLSEAMTN
jgi:hypothetical protein